MCYLSVALTFCLNKLNLVIWLPYWSKSILTRIMKYQGCISHRAQHSNGSDPPGEAWCFVFFFRPGPIVLLSHTHCIIQQTSLRQQRQKLQHQCIVMCSSMLRFMVRTPSLSPRGNASSSLKMSTIPQNPFSPTGPEKYEPICFFQKESFPKWEWSQSSRRCHLDVQVPH